VTDPTAASQVGITVLTILAFMFSGWGVLHVLLSARRTARRVRDDEVANRTADDAYRDALGIAGLIADADGQSAARKAAVDVWYKDYADRGLLAPSIENSAREPLAERLIDELADGSRADAILVGVGLLFGLAASLWATWA
jgi:hypothetical protein